MHPLQKAIESRGYTINSFATHAGISPQVIYNITSGKRTIDRMGVSQFGTIAHALGLTIDELISELEADDGEG